MGQLAQMKVFVAVAEHASFAHAARILGTSRPTVTRSIAALEASLGVQLLVRTTRRVALSPEGERYLDDCRQILESVREAAENARGSHARPQGHLRITAPVLFGRLHVLPTLRAFLDATPEVTAELRLLDRVTNLIEEGLDVAVRIGTLPDSSLRAVRVGTVHRVVVGSPEYLARMGRPESPDALAGHTLLLHASRARWTFADRQLPVRGRLATTDIASTLALAEQGFGLCQVLSYQSGPGVAAGRLEPLLVEHQAPPVPVHLVFAGPRIPVRTRAFVDHATAALRERAARDWRGFTPDAQS